MKGRSDDTEEERQNKCEYINKRVTAIRLCILNKLWFFISKPLGLNWNCKESKEWERVEKRKWRFIEWLSHIARQWRTRGFAVLCLNLFYLSVVHNNILIKFTNLPLVNSMKWKYFTNIAPLATACPQPPQHTLHLHAEMNWHTEWVSRSWDRQGMTLFFCTLSTFIIIFIHLFNQPVHVY